MRYDQKEFAKAVSYYKQKLKATNAKNVFIYGTITRKGFFSIAPLSRAASDLKMDMKVSLDHNVKGYVILFDVWKAYQDLKNEISYNHFKSTDDPS